MIRNTAFFAALVVVSACPSPEPGATETHTEGPAVSEPALVPGAEAPAEAAEAVSCAPVAPIVAGRDEGVALPSSLYCTSAPSSGRFTAEVEVAVPELGGPVAVMDVRFVKMTPIPLVRSWMASGRAEPGETITARGLPLALLPGERGSFQISGDYMLHSNEDPDARANFHFELALRMVDGGRPFVRELSIHVTSGAEPELEGPGGPPPGRPL